MPDPSAATLRVDALQEALTAVRPDRLTLEAAKDSAKLLELASQAPVVRLVELVLTEAVSRRASDIHIEAFEHDVIVRFRIDGICYEVIRPPKSLALAIASRIKILANLDVAESRLPQDGRILVERENRQIDLRISTLPTLYGESIVLRVLDKGALTKTLTDLGMAAGTQQAIERLITQPHGLFLVTGPTGSGKTTTLYACLTKLNTEGVKIITTEDPVEYDVAGLVQVAINQKIGLDFAACLRSILRHDPDIIMVGEIRDLETAQIAIQAALTGHLVFSTLHTNDAAGAVTRLLDMGVAPFLITSTVAGVLAQRLVRRLCPSCRAPDRLLAEVVNALESSATIGKEALRLTPEQRLAPVMRPVGCDACQGLGFHGRIGAFELLLMQDRIRTLVLERQTVGAVKEAARQAGLVTLREDGVKKVCAGETTVEEVLRETQSDE